MPPSGGAFAQRYRGRELDFPIQLDRARKLPEMKGVESVRSRKSRFLKVGQRRVHIQCLTIEHLGEGAAVELLEHFYQKRRGKSLIE